MPSIIPTVTRVGGKTNEQTVMKRRKTGAQDISSLRREAGYQVRLFAPFRTIGLVSPTPVPFTSIPLGKTTFQVTTSVGRCLQTYDLKRGLQLVFLTRPETPSEITATLAWKDCVLAAWSNGADGASAVWMFKRGKRIDQLEPPPAPCEPILQLLAFGSWIIGCCFNRLHVWKSATYEHYTTLTPAGLRRAGEDRVLSGCVCSIPTFINKILVGRQDGGVEIWNVSAGKLVYTILPPSSEYGAVTALQPTPALSVVAIAFHSGPLLLHNVRTDKSILQLNSAPLQSQPVSTISFRTDGLGAGEEGRLPGVMATGGAHSGDVSLWDLNEAGKLMGVLRGAHYPRSSASGAVGGGVNKVEFLPGQPVMVTCGLDNSLKTWIFDEAPFLPVPRPLHARSGHAAPLTKLAFIPSDADGAEGGGKWLLTAARDRSLWAWSLRRDAQSTELSQGNIRKRAKKVGILSGGATESGSSGGLERLKASEITCVAISLNRDGGIGATPNAGPVWSNARVDSRKKGASAAAPNDMTGWESVVTGHRGDKIARTWFWGRKKAGRWAFETGDRGVVTSVAITACGTFALVGSSLGGIDMFNLQSGLHRQRYPAKSKPRQGNLKTTQRSLISDDGTEPLARTFGPGEGKHQGAVTGIVVDGVNRMIISCGLDGKLKFWSFTKGVLLQELEQFPLTSITALRYHLPNDLVAFSCEDQSIRLVDIETRKLVRELRGSKATVNDFCFSNDGRWIIAGTADCIVRVWDLPTGHLIDALRVQSPCTALAFSNTGEFLATAHADGVGVNIWTNRTLFTHVPTRPVTESEVARIQQPTASGESGATLIEAAYGEVEDGDVVVDGSASVIERLDEQLTSLSLVPKSRWQTLVQLDLIKQRNKPKEPPKAPERAPFFLSSLSSLDGSKPRRLASDKTGEDQLPAAAELSRITKLSIVGGSSSERSFTVLLREGARSGNFDSFISHLKGLSPAAADLEIRSLATASASLLRSSTVEGNDQQALDERIPFVYALTSRLRQKQDYELVQAWMTVFLRVHGGEILSSSAAHGEGSTPPSLLEALTEWRKEQQSEAKRISALTGYCAGVIGFLRNAKS